MVGQDTIDKIDSMHVDWAFLGAEGVHHERGLTNINTVEIPIKQAMIRAAERTAVLADSSKIGYRALSYVCDMSAIDRVITDNRVTPKQRALWDDKLTLVPL